MQKKSKQTDLLEYRDAYQGDIGHIHRRYTTQLSEIRLEPAGATMIEMGSKSKYTTIGTFSYIGGDFLR